MNAFYSRVVNVMNFKSRKPFSDSEFMKNCVLNMPEDVCSETQSLCPNLYGHGVFDK